MTLQPKRVKELLERAADKKILVVGDLMLDRYITGQAERISPEAPVPVVLVDREYAVPGGASNVALNVRALGGMALLGGLAGRDQAGHELMALLEERGIDVCGVLRHEGLRTCEKTRIMAQRQQVVRVDREAPAADAAHLVAPLAALLRRLVDRVDGVVIEDYGKGVVQQAVVDAVLSEAHARALPTGYDPKDNHELNVQGVKVATPNRWEVFLAAGMRPRRPADQPLQDDALLEACDVLMGRWEPELLAATLGAQGMLLLSRTGAPVHIPTRAREVFDVSGAGDTVIAVCLLALAAGADTREAAEMANYAAGIVVGKIGTATCTPDELLRAVPS